MLTVSSLVISIALQYNIIMLTTCVAKLFHKLEQLGGMIHILLLLSYVYFRNEYYSSGTEHECHSFKSGTDS
jgi:hypothetical protein